MRPYLLLLIFTVALAACAPLATPAPSTPTATAAASETPSPTVVNSATPTVSADSLNPLTGLPVSDPAILNRHPVAVKISNYPRSNRPQWGLSLADIVYEYYHNNDLTRFYAIFYGQDASLAGPIRSGRMLDSALMDLYSNVLVFASADSRVLDRLNGHPVWQLVGLLEGGDCPPHPVCRYQPETSNFLLADTAAVKTYAEGRGGNVSPFNLDGMLFAADPPQGGETVDRIYLDYSYSAYSYWEYDADSGRYFRFQDTQENLGARTQEYAPLYDQLTDQPVAADNVVILYIPHFHFYYRSATETSPAIEIVDMDFFGRGQAVGFRDGQAYDVEWVIENEGVLYLADATGAKFPFKPGTTWFQVMNDDSRLNVEEDGSWRFEFIFRRP